MDSHDDSFIKKKTFHLVKSAAFPQQTCIQKIFALHDTVHFTTDQTVSIKAKMKVTAASINYVQVQPDAAKRGCSNACLHWSLLITISCRSFGSRKKITAAFAVFADFNLMIYVFVTSWKRLLPYLNLSAVRLGSWRQRDVWYLNF